MYLLDADKAAKKLQEILDTDLHAHGSRSSSSFIDTEPIRYCALQSLIEGYVALRKHQRKMRKLLKSIKEIGEDIRWYDLDEVN